MVRDEVAAGMLYQRLAPWPASVASITAVIYGSIAHYLGQLATVLGQHDTAETHFTQALAAHERLQAPFHIARTHLEWSRLLLARSHPDNNAARRHLQSARDLAQRHGCALVEHRSAERLAHL